MSKGEYPAHLNGDGSLKEGVEKRRWTAVFSAFWASIPTWLQIAAVSALTGSSVMAGTWSRSNGDSEAELRHVVREEMSVMNAGFKAFVATQPEKTQLAVLRAMERAGEKLKEGK